MTVINFTHLPENPMPQKMLFDAYVRLIGYHDFGISYRFLGKSSKEIVDRYPEYYAVDVIGNELVWMNENFCKEKYTWYLWFESIFLVPDEMACALHLRWS